MQEWDFQNSREEERRGPPFFLGSFFSLFRYLLSISTLLSSFPFAAAASAVPLSQPLTRRKGEEEEEEEREEASIRKGGKTAGVVGVKFAHLFSPP